MSVISLVDVVNFLKEELNESYFSDAEYKVNTLIEDGNKSISVFYRNGYVEEVGYRDSLYKTLPITVHFLSNRDENRELFFNEMYKISYKLLRSFLHKRVNIGKFNDVIIKKDLRDMIYLGQNSKGQQEYVIDFNILY